MATYFPPTPEQLKTTRGRERAEVKALKHWPEARGKLRELQECLEENKMGITADQVSMVLQLAEISFARRAHKRAPREKRWTDVQLRKMWSQSCSELLGYKWALQLNRELELSLGMALMLAQDAFRRLK